MTWFGAKQAVVNQNQIRYLNSASNILIENSHMTCLFENILHWNGGGEEMEAKKSKLETKKEIEMQASPVFLAFSGLQTIKHLFPYISVNFKLFIHW